MTEADLTTAKANLDAAMIRVCLWLLRRREARLETAVARRPGVGSDDGASLADSVPVPASSSLPSLPGGVDVVDVIERSLT